MPRRFDARWQDAMALIVQTFREQQRKDGQRALSLHARTEFHATTVAGRRLRLPCQARRPDLLHFPAQRRCDVFPYLMPSNFFAVVSLRQMAEMLANELSKDEGIGEAMPLAWLNEVEQAVARSMPL